MGFLEQALENAPSDPVELLIHLESSIPDDWDGYSELDFLECNRFLTKFVERYGIELLDLYDMDDANLEACQIDESERSKLHVWCSKIRANRTQLMSGPIFDNVDGLLDMLDKQIDPSKRYGTYGQASLSDVEKGMLREHLDHIRGIIDRSPLSDRKKNALFGRIAELQNEVDRSGTRTDAFFAFLGDLGLAMGDMAENAQPALDEAKKILGIVVARRAEDEGVKLQSSYSIFSLNFSGTASKQETTK